MAWSDRAQGRARRRLLLRPRLGSGEDSIPPRVEVEAGPWGRARRRPPSEVEVEAEPWGRAMRKPPSEVEAGAEPWGWARRRLPPEAEAQGRARRSFLLRLRLDSAAVSDSSAVSLTLAGGTAVGEGRAALFSCQVSQWEGEVTTVTSTLPTEACVSG
jgi:hypothetical protein